LPVCQYDETRMEQLVQGRFELVEAVEDIHITPGGSCQRYCFFLLKPISE